MNNTSASGGYLLPAAPTPLPGSLTFEQFLQQVFVGISGLPGDLVRPKWQVNPPKQPDFDIDWLAIALVDNEADANAYTGPDSNGVNTMQRHEALEVACSFYGPNAMDFAALVRDGFQVSQNLEVLRSALMGFVSTNKIMRVPDLVNERWIDRYEMSVFLRREIVRTYPVLNLVSSSGILHTVIGNTEKSVAWKSNA